MKTLPYLIGALILFTAASRADDITLADGTVLKNAKIVSHDASSAMIVYSAGVTKVDMKKLPAEIQKVLAMEVPTAAPAAEAPPTPPATPSPATTATSPVVPAPPPPITLTPDQQYRLRRALTKSAMVVEGKVERVLPEGFIGHIWTRTVVDTQVPHSERVNTVPEGLGHVPVYATRTWTTTESHESIENIGRVFVHCRSDGLVDDDKWNGTVWRVGAYQPGDSVTVAKYTTDIDEAVQYYAQQAASPNR